ncbi:MAG TPA: hypothetical protein VGI82_14745, partial [Chitinophagaceae bacterium]
MKKNLKIIFAGAFLLLISCFSSNGQSVTSGVPFSEDMRTERSTSQATETGIPSPAVLKSFTRNNKGITDEKWYETSYGYVAKFNLKGIGYRTDYDKKGNWLYTIRTYDETKLPEEVRQFVKSNYYD